MIPSILRTLTHALNIFGEMNQSSHPQEINVKAQQFRTLLISGKIHGNYDFKQGIVNFLKRQNGDSHEVKSLETLFSRVSMIRDLYESGKEHLKDVLSHSQTIAKCGIAPDLIAE